MESEIDGVGCACNPFYKVTMNAILLPIKKIFSDSIFAGAKVIEYRKSLPSLKVEQIYIYESRGCGMVVGECEVNDTIYCDLESLWNRTYNLGGVSESQFYDYFKGADKGIGYVLGNCIRYGQPLPLSHFGLSRAPQNYVWIKEDF